MALHLRRQIGQILMDGGFLKKTNLEQACEEQKRTHELLGQVLVRMGVLKEHQIKTPLLIQDHLSSIDDAVKIAAGERQLLGVLLVQTGKITCKQLDAAIAEQKRTGDRLGEVFTRLGMLTERQLEALLEFQHNQGDTNIVSPLRLGELLVATGYISREQLKDALQKQNISHKKIGEVLVEEGYITTRNLNSGFRLQKMLVKSVLATIMSLGIGVPAMAQNVSLQWDPNTEANLAGYKVYYSPDSAPLESAIPLDVGLQTTAALSGLDPSHSYQFAVTAYSTDGIESSFSNVVTLAEQEPPTVGITSPQASANVSGVVTVSVNAADNVGVTKVEFYVNGVLKATDTASPYAFSWDTLIVAPGTYTLMAKAYDAAGNVSQASSTVNVVNDTIPPTVAMTSPANNAILSGSVTVSSSASDNVGVTSVEFYGNGVLLYASNVAPYSFNWDTTKIANGNYTLFSIAKDNAGNTAQSSTLTVTVNNTVADTIAPAINSFTLPTTSSSLTVPVTGLSAADAVGVTGYLISESSTKPLASDARWSGSVPASFTFSSAGTKTAYAWAKDAAGNVSASRSATVSITLPDVTAPTVNSFTLPTSSSSLTVPVTGLSAADAVGVTGYLISESSTKPLASDARWSGSVPASFTFSSAGTKTAYAWAKDAAGNVSASRSATVSITLPDVTAPTVNSFTLPTSSSSLTVPVTGLSAADAVGVTGYLISESSTKPLASDARWSGSVPASFTFSSAGTKTAYAWAKDAAGNVSASRSATVSITLPDVTAPTVNSFSLPTSSNSLTVPVTGLSAADAVGVTGYLISESSTRPLASDARWSGSVPASFTFSSAGTKTAYAWAKDAAGNVSASRSATVVITLDVTAPQLVSFKMPTTSKSLTVPITSLAATDNVGVTGYLISESSSRPSAGDVRWSSSAPTSFTFSSAGTKIVYVWAKDAAGNISGSLAARVKISLR